MGFFRKLLGLCRAQASDTHREVEGPATQYQGFTIRPSPYLHEGQYQACGVISKSVNGQMRQHRFVRSDRFARLEDAFQMIEIKARRLIDEQGDQLFDH